MLLAAVVLVVSTLSVVGYLGARARSAEERRARVEAESAGVAWDVVRVEPLREVVSFDVEFAPATIRVVVAPRVIPDEVNLVTALSCVEGAEILPGQLVAEVSGRPIFALPLDLPLHRDLRLGLRGGDVTRFQRAMRRLGYQVPAREDGVFGFATAAALVKFYRDRGAVVPETLLPDNGRPTPVAMRDLMLAVSDGPVVVSEAAAQLGQPAPEGTPLCELASPSPKVVGRPSEAQMKLLRSGQTAQLVLSDGTVLAAEVTEVVSAESGDNPDRLSEGRPPADQPASRSPQVVFQPSEGTDQLSIGERGRADVVVAESDGPVVSVNVECVRSAANGTSQVDLDARSAGSSRATVELGPSIGGRVVVVRSDPPLRQGDRCRLHA